MANQYVQYYVEGDDEKKLLRVLKDELGAILPGKIQKLNVIQNKIKDTHLRVLHPGTMVVLVFDTDTGSIDMLNQNLESLHACSAVSEVVTIPQVKNLEDELVHSCDIKKVEDLLGSRSRQDFKSDLIRASNLAGKLREHKFDIGRFWCKAPGEPYQNIENQAEKVKIAG